jgi:hypothetical protein
MNPEDDHPDMAGYEWVPITEKISLPEFIEARAKGEMKMEDGVIYRKEPIDYSYQDDYWDYNNLPDEEPSREDVERYEDKHGK